MNIYGSSAAAALAGNHENTEIGEFIRDYLELDLDSVTRKLQEETTRLNTNLDDGTQLSWMGPLPAEDERLDAFDHYHGDF